MAALEAVVLSRAPVAIVVVDAVGRVAYLNRAAEVLYGWTGAEVNGRVVSAVGIQPADGDLPPGLLDTIAGGGSWDGELPIRRRDGSSTTVHASLAPLYDARGDYVGFISVAFVAATLRDQSGANTERKPREIGRRLAQARREAALTQQQVADELGVTRRSLQGYEAGAVVPYKHLDRLGELLGRTPQWFLTGDDAARRPQTDDLREIVRDEITTVLSQAGVVPPETRVA
jgi:PAS domain S-box-containing protein